MPTAEAPASLVNEPTTCCRSVSALEPAVACETVLRLIHVESPAAAAARSWLFASVMSEVVHGVVAGPSFRKLTPGISDLRKRILAVGCRRPGIGAFREHERKDLRPVQQHHPVGIRRGAAQTHTDRHRSARNSCDGCEKNSVHRADPGITVAALPGRMDQARTRAAPSRPTPIESGYLGVWLAARRLGYLYGGRSRVTEDVETATVEPARLVELLGDPHRAFAARTRLIALGSRAQSAVIVGLGHAEPRVRAQCCAVRHHIADAGSLRAVEGALDDPVPDVRMQAIHTLAWLDRCKSDECRPDAARVLPRNGTSR